MARVERKLDVEAVFITSGEEEGKAEESGLWKQVKALPGVTMTKASGEEAQRFHAATSGDAFLYDGAGNLQYRGGLTASRGHAGDNAGVDAIVRILKDREVVTPASGPVFGCALESPQRQASQ